MGVRDQLTSSAHREPVLHGRWILGKCLLLTAFAASGFFPVHADAQTRWALSADPTLVIGSVDGPAHELFHETRGVISTPDGVIVVATRRPAQLRVFSEEGEYLRSFGRAGDGPAEFRSLAWIDTCGGRSIVAYDTQRYRITRWDTEGSLLDGFSVQGPRGELLPYRVACGPSGDFVVIGWPDVGGVARELGPYRPMVAIAVTDERGRRERVIGEFPGEERLRTSNNDRPHPFGKSTVAELGPGGVYVGTADAFEIVLVTPDGERRIFGRNRPVAPLTREMRDRWIEAYIAPAPAERKPELRRSLRASEWIPDVAPAYAGFRIDRLGFIWVEPHPVAGPSTGDSAEWTVFDPEGAFVATVLIPRHFRPTEIGSDYLLGVSTDEMGVERVHRYGLSR